MIKRVYCLELTLSQPVNILFLRSGYMYTISQVSEELNISAHTLRYYEKESIITPDRSPNGERLYTADHVAWLKFVIKLKETKMPLAKIRQYAELFKEGEKTAQARLELLENHHLLIQEQLQTLIATEEMLTHKISTYKKVLAKQNV